MMLRSCVRDSRPFGPMLLGMHPLVAIGLVFLAAIAWTVTILTMLIVVVKARRQPPVQVRHASLPPATSNRAD
jgi:hypothetical protein